MKHKYKAPPHWAIFCIIFCILWTSTPVSGSVQDNLQSVVAKILGQKNETTNAANFNNASTNAKLNYLNSKMSNLETKVEVSGVPHIAETGTIDANSTKTFNGTGYLLLTNGFSKATIDGFTTDKCLPFTNSDHACHIDFQETLIIDNSTNRLDAPYVLYLY